MFHSITPFRQILKRKLDNSQCRFQTKTRKYFTELCIEETSFREPLEEHSELTEPIKTGDDEFRAKLEDNQAIGTLRMILLDP